VRQRIPLSRCRCLAFVGFVLFAISACEQPFDRTPAGYAEACYGGKENAKRNWVCSENRMIVTTSGTESEWPALGKIVADFGRSRSLDVFDTSTRIPEYIRTLQVSVCSAEGLFLLLDKRIYHNEQLNRDGDAITIALRTYRNSYQWQPLSKQLLSELREKWPYPIEAQWPAPRGSDRALPDSVQSCEESRA
jgi:hypothetical protein